MTYSYILEVKGTKVMNEYKVKIIIATHKKYQMPSENMYIPLHVGAEGKKDLNDKELNLGYIKDNTGDNISNLNSCFCELTGLYWAWKNLDADYIGLVHYRRYFSMEKKKNFDKVLSYNQLKPYLGKIKVFVPNKRKYYIETLYSHYSHTHYAVQLDETREIIRNKYPEYLTSYDKIINHRYGYMFNMMIMEKSLLDNYCTWLFDILFELKEKNVTSELDSFQARFYGRVSEILFNVWLDNRIINNKIKKKEIMEIPCIHMENIDWSKKIIAFLNAKFFGKKYKGSF